MDEHIANNPVTPEQQAADVINHYHAGENKEFRDNGWPDKVSLGVAAIHTTVSEHSILPAEPGKPAKSMLTNKEMGAGLDYIKNPPKHPREEPARSDAYYKELERLVDQGMLSYDEARQKLEGEDL